MRQRCADIFPFLPKRTGLEATDDLYNDYKRRQEVVWRRRAAAERAEADAISAGRSKVFNAIQSNWQRLGLPDLNLLTDVNGGRTHLTTKSGRPIGNAITRRQFFSDAFDYLHNTQTNFHPHPQPANPHYKSKSTLRPEAAFQRLYNDDLDFKARRAQIGLARVLLEEKEREKRIFLRNEYARRRYAQVAKAPRDPKTFYARLHAEGAMFAERRQQLQDAGSRAVIQLEKDRYQKRGEMLRSKLLHMTAQNEVQQEDTSVEHGTNKIAIREGTHMHHGWTK